MGDPTSPQVRAAEELELVGTPSDTDVFEDIPTDSPPSPAVQISSSPEKKPAESPTKLSPADEVSPAAARKGSSPSRVKAAAAMFEASSSNAPSPSKVTPSKKLSSAASPSASFRSIPASASGSIKATPVRSPPLERTPSREPPRSPSPSPLKGAAIRQGLEESLLSPGIDSTPIAGRIDRFSDVPLTVGTPGPSDRTPRSASGSRIPSPLPPPPADLAPELPEPVVTPPSQPTSVKTSYFSSFGFATPSTSLSAEPTSVSHPPQRSASSNSQQGGWRSAVGNLFAARSATASSVDSVSSSTTPATGGGSSHLAAPSAPARLPSPSRTPSTSFLLHRIGDEAASRDRRISREMGGGDRLRAGFERVRGEMESAARDMRRERQGKAVAEPGDNEEQSGVEGAIDWPFWGSVVQDYEEVARTRPKELSRAIQQGIPAVIRGSIWQLMSSSKSPPLEETYKALLKETSPHEKAIAKDLSRTFPHHKYFQEGGGVGQESLYMVVKAYSLYDQDVGYTQGLAFIVAALLLNMPDEEAFCVLVRLMDSYNLRSHFMADMPGLQLRLFQFDRLVEEILPLLHTHFTRKGVKSSMYASQWFMTLFSYRFPLSLVYRVLDIVFAEGIEAIFRFSLALLQKSEDKLVELEFEQILHFLQTDLFEVYRVKADEGVGPDGDVLGEDEWRANDFVRDAYAVRITPFQLDSYEGEYNDKMRDQNAHALELDMLRNANRNLSSQVKQLEASLATSNQEHVELVRQLVMVKIEKEETEAELVRYKMLYAELAHAQQDAMSVHSRFSSASLLAGPSGASASSVTPERSGSGSA